MKPIGTVLCCVALLLGSAIVSTDYAGHRDGVAHAGLRDGGGKRGGGLNSGGNRGTKASRGRASKIDRKPRASSARSGSVKPKANKSKPRKASAKAKSRAGDRPKASGQRPAGLSSVSDAKARKARPDRAPTAGSGQQRSRQDLARKMDQPAAERPAVGTANRTAPSKDLRNRQVSTQQRDLQKRDLEQGRKEYESNRQDIRNDRGDTLTELQENRLDFKEGQREDRMDFAEDRREDRMDFAENRRDDLLDERRRLYDDLYDPHRYWGYDDDDDDNWFWLLFGGVAGYAIGASMNDEPEGAVPVTSGDTTYQYYGGTFYQPSPDGQGYTTVPAPVDAQVEAPPIDCTVVFTPPPDDLGYCYFQGAFFLYDDSTDSYVVATPEAGTEVPYLPDGYEVLTLDGVDYYQLGSITYRPYLDGDEEVFVVAGMSG